MTDLNQQSGPGGTFGKCLKFFLLTHGTRSYGSPDKTGERWILADFATEVGVSTKAVQNWLRDQKLPRDLRSIERVLFGSAKRYDDWKKILRLAHIAMLEQRSSKSKEANSEPESGVSSDVKLPDKPSATATETSPQILHPEIRAVRDFTGRGELLDTLDRALWQDGGSVALTNSAAIHGLGGVGKSVLAQEYGWRNRERYRGVWWLRPEHPETLLDDLIQLGSRLGVPAIGEIPEKDRAAHLALDAIRDTATDKPWLLIYDNAESPAAIDRLTPRERAHLIVTSRWSDWHGHAEELPVDVFPEEVAADYLMAHARHPDRDAAKRLAEALGYLPLALSHARATCWASNLDFDSYRERLSEQLRKAPRGADYPQPVYATFDLAIRKAASLCPQAERLMEIAAFFAPDRIPVSLVTDDVMSVSERDDALAALAELSLITHETLEDGAPAFTVHRLVQAVMRARQGERWKQTAAEALQLVLAATPKGKAVAEHTEWQRIEKLLPHVLVNLRYAPNEGEYALATAWLCNQLGGYLHARAIYTEAEPLYKRTLAIREKVLGPDNPSLSRTLNNLAGLYYHQGWYSEAESLSKRALAICENEFESDHVSVSASLNGLALIHHAQGRYDEAEPLMKRALTIREEALGSDHPDVGASINGLGGIYHAQGRTAEAEQLHLRALTIREKALGSDHPDFANSLANLAALYCSQARNSEAEPLYIRALAILEASLGPDHPHTKWGKAKYEALKADMAAREGEA